MRLVVDCSFTSVTKWCLKFCLPSHTVKWTVMYHTHCIWLLYSAGIWPLLEWLLQEVSHFSTSTCWLPGLQSNAIWMIIMVVCIPFVYCYLWPSINQWYEHSSSLFPWQSSASYLLLLHLSWICRSTYACGGMSCNYATIGHLCLFFHCSSSRSFLIIDAFWLFSETVSSAICSAFVTL